MSRKNKKNMHSQDDLLSSEPEDLATENTTDKAQSEAPAAPPSLEEQIEQLRDEKHRLHAELQNVVKRTQRDKQEALRFAEADFTRNLLIVLDDLERTLESMKTADDVQTVAEGVRIVYDHFLGVLRGRGIEPIEATDKPFDPDRHEAVMQQPSDEHPAGTVMQEFQRGYAMHGRVIRPAKVVVSGGKPARLAEEAEKEV